MELGDKRPRPTPPPTPSQAYTVTVTGAVTHGLSPKVESFVDRYLKILENEQAQQRQIDELTSILRQANQRSKRAIDRIQEAISHNEK